MNAAAFFVASSSAFGFGVGLIHIGFALTDPSPRNIWDWYVVAMGLCMIATAFPAMRWIASQT